MKKIAPHRAVEYQFSAAFASRAPEHNSNSKQRKDSNHENHHRVFPPTN
jgi:hypothetical protein